MSEPKPPHIVYVVAGYLTPDLTAYALDHDKPKSLVVMDHGRRKAIRKSSIRGFAYSEDEARKIADDERAKEIGRLERQIARLREPLRIAVVDPKPHPKRTVPLDF